MSKKLPAQVRVHIRDLIEAPESELQQALKTLNTNIGSGFKLEIAWEDVFRDLQSSFPDDRDRLVPSVARHVIVFVQRLGSVLEQDEKFQETFMEEYGSLSNALAVVIQSGTKTTCKIVNRKITLLLPTTGDYGFRQAQTTVGSDIHSLFDEDRDEKASTSHPAAVDDADEDWDTVNIVSSKADISAGKQDNRQPLKFQDAASVKPRPLPKLNSLQRPETLFSELLPAFLTIKGNDRELYVEGSHTATINLIAEYFKTFARKDMMDANQTPCLKIDLVTSNFGSGAMSDCIKIEVWYRQREFRINVAMLLSFIEAICGYEMVKCDGNSYLYKRTTPF